MRLKVGTDIVVIRGVRYTVTSETPYEGIRTRMPLGMTYNNQVKVIRKTEVFRQDQGGISVPTEVSLGTFIFSVLPLSQDDLKYIPEGLTSDQLRKLYIVIDGNMYIYRVGREQTND